MTLLFDLQFQQDEEDPTQFGRSWTKGLDYYRMDGSTGVQSRQACAQAFNDIENYRLVT